MKKKIYLVDDKITIAKIVSIYLQADFEFEYFDNPLPCIEKLKDSNNVPDLIISDIKMPNMNGGEFLAYLKASDTLKKIPVIMLSSEDSSTQRIKLLADGADDYIIKPFNPMELQIRIKKILG